MRTRLSKHGKYRFYEGTYGELKNMLQPDDICGEPVEESDVARESVGGIRIIQRVAAREVMEQVMETLPWYGRMASAVARLLSPAEGFSHAWLVQNIHDGRMFVWFGEHDDASFAIKRRITKDDAKDAHVHVGAIIGERVNTTGEDEPEPAIMPDEPGFWEDCEGDLWLVTRRNGNLVNCLVGSHGELFHFLVEEHELNEAYVRYAPFHRVNVSYEIKEEA